MIVQPSFFTHWKTKLLIDMTKDPASPLKLQKLWAYCQDSKAFEFSNLTPNKIKAIGGFEGDPVRIYHILHKECEFIDEIERDGKVFVRLHDWDKFNSSLISSWKNGARGGRPKKPNHNPTEDWVNPRETQPEIGLTHSGIGVTDKIREEKIRKDKRRGEDKESSSGSSSFLGKVFKKDRRKSQRVEENTALMNRIGSWFRRRPETLWQVDEARELASLGEVPESELELLDWWFLKTGEGDTTDKKDERNYKRRKITQLLNNWSAEIDRANEYKRQNDLIWGDNYGPEV